MVEKIAVVETSRCVACGACENICPLGAIAVYKGCYAHVNPEKCVGCGKCAKSCPACIIEVKERSMV